MTSGSNIGEAPEAVNLIVSSVGEETAALDALGPRTRAALNNARFRWSAISLLRQIHESGYRPTDPHLDAFASAYIEREDAAMLARENQRRGL